jgi:2-polyprenyl-3-methyl-5-hydroxy-6-metoxy-1,4-benzoquinol methylase
MWRGDFDGDVFQARFDELEAGGGDVHGEAAFVASLEPRSVLDAGCGTGRVAIELARRGIAVVGVDLDPSMLATAQRRGPEVEWIQHDLATLDLGRTFDIVMMAGNVPLFTKAGTHAALVAGCASHVAPTGLLVAGFQIQRGYTIESYDEHCRAAGLALVQRYATWEAEPFVEGGEYAVSVHRKPTSG